MGSPGARKATTVTVRFLDDEIMEGQVGTISLNQPNIELEMPEASINERALVPLPSIKRITLAAGAPSAEEQARAERKVAIRFQDGEVLKGYLDGELRQASHGLTLRLLSVEKDRIETLGIPYTALKALFYLKTWDTRPPEFDGKEDRHLTKRLSSPIVDMISDMGQLDQPRKRRAITQSEFPTNHRTHHR